MPTIETKLKIPSCWLEVKMTYNESVKDYIKSFPGSKWNKVKRVWEVPLCYGRQILDFAKEYGYENTKNEEVLEFDLPQHWNHGYAYHDKMRHYQRTAVQRFIGMRDAQNYILNFEMGLGKTMTALGASCVESILIICPAMARQVWRDEIEKWCDTWWEDKDVEVITTGNQAKTPSKAKVRIVSYGLLGKMNFDDFNPQRIILDELHLLQSPSAIRTQEVKKVLLRYPRARVLGLTGTMFNNNPASAWQPLDLLFPGQFGSAWQFKTRYMNLSYNDYGYPMWTGINKLYEDELKQRLGGVLYRVTKADVHNSLPPFVSSLRHIEDKYREKESYAAVQDLLDEGNKHVALMVWKRADAESLSTYLRKNKIKAITITGDHTPEKRAELLKQAQETPGTCIVATIDSTKVAIDMTFCTGVVYADLVDSAGTMIQSLGRFHRINSTAPVTAVFLLEAHNKKAKNVLAKVEAINALVSGGTAETQLQKTLKTLKTSYTDDELRDALSFVAEQYTGIDPDLEF